MSFKSGEGKRKISTQAKLSILPELILFPIARGLSKYCYSPWMGCQQIKVYSPTLYHVCPMIFQCSSVLQGGKSKVRVKCLPQKIQHNGVTWSWNPDFTTVERIMQLLCLLPSVTFLAEIEQGDTICITNSCVLKLLGNESDRERPLCSYGCWLDHAESYWNPKSASSCETWLWQGQFNKSEEVRWNDLNPLTPISD